MKRCIIAVAAATSLGLAACGSSDGDSKATSQVDQVLDTLSAAVTGEGGTLDRDCAKEQLDKMNDADLATLSTATVDQDVTLSDEGEALGDAITACISLPPDTTDTTGDDTATAGTIDVSGMNMDDLREALVTSMMANTEGMTVDEQCLRDAVDKLSEDDLRAIVSAGIDGDPDVSAEADAIAMSLVECITDFGDVTDTSDSSGGSIPEGMAMTDALIDVFVDQVEASGMKADRPCIEQALEGVEVAELADAMNNSELMSKLTACITP